MIFGRSVYAVLCLPIATASVAMNISKLAMERTIVCVLSGPSR